MIRQFIFSSITILSMLFSCAEYDQNPNSDIMYFLLIDRFVDGDSTNNSGSNPESYQPYNGSNPAALKQYQGGDLKGIINSLDSLKDMGITMLWLSPFLDNSNTDYVGWWPYHGYHPIDFYGVDEHYGTLSDLKTLVNQAHMIGLKVIFDMPFNQTAQDHPWVLNQTKPGWFHLDDDGQPFGITNWFDQKQIEQGELHGLPDLAQEVDAVSDYLIEVSKYWILETGCDGFRLDAVKHIPLSFWEKYNTEIKQFAGPEFLLFGEVFWGEAERIAPYSNIGFDYLFDIPGYYAIRNTFNKGGSIKDFSSFYENNSTVLSAASFATIIDNHDVSRFNVGLGDLGWKKQILALGWLMTSPGLPVIYSGTEIGMQGFPVEDGAGNPQDFLNRIPMPKSFDNTEQARRSEFSRLTQLRHEHIALSAGSFTEIYKDWSVYAFMRSHEDETLLVVLNNASSEEYISLPGLEGMTIDNPKPIYGSGALRTEAGEWWLRLAPNELNIWKLSGKNSFSNPVRVPFTDRLSKDYELIELSYADSQKQVDLFQVAGDFNNWTPDGYKSLRRNDSLFIELPLKPGTYAYKLVLNGTDWIADPHAKAFSIDPYGGKNSTLVVP